MNPEPIRLVLPYPVSANRYWASRAYRAKATGKWLTMTYVTPEAEAYRQEVRRIAVMAGLAKPLTCRMRIDLQLYPQRPLDWMRRVRKDPMGWDDDVQCIDVGNARKVLEDALEGIVYDNDKRVWQGTQERMEPDAQPARAVVTIRPVLRQTVQFSLLDEAMPA